MDYRWILPVVCELYQTFLKFTARADIVGLPVVLRAPYFDYRDRDIVGLSPISRSSTSKTIHNFRSLARGDHAPVPASRVASMSASIVIL